MPNVDIVERRLFPTPAALSSFMRSLERQPGDNVAFEVDQRWTLWGICRRVRELAGFVGVLRIHCHGNASYIQLGPGLSVPPQTSNFQVLRGVWTGRYPRIEIHACAVVSSTPIACGRRGADWDCTPGVSDPDAPGRDLVQAIADNAGVPAIGALNAQWDPPGFEGGVVYCIPAEYFTMASMIGH